MKIPSPVGVSDLLAPEPFPTLSAPGRLGVFAGSFATCSSAFIIAHFVTFDMLIYVPLKEKTRHCDHERTRPDTVRCILTSGMLKLFVCLLVCLIKKILKWVNNFFFFLRIKEFPFVCWLSAKLTGLPAVSCHL